MSTTLTRWSCLLVVLGLIMTLIACGETENKSDKDNAPQPVLEAQLGDTWDEVIQHSTLELGPLAIWAGTIINQPHTFVYRDPRHWMQLDNVGYTGISFKYETHRILDFGIGPYRESAGVDETWQRLQDIIYKMEHAGWIPDDDRNKRTPTTKSAAALRCRYINLPAGAKGDQKYWYDEYGNDAWVRLVKTFTGDEPGEEPRFNLVLQINAEMNPKKPKATQ